MGIIVKNITHIYSEGLPHETTALDNVSFEINRFGQVYTAPASERAS